LSEILIGTSGWNYPRGRGTWNGVFYPQPRPRGFDELAFYAEHFDTVEVNSSFYRPLEPSVAASWVRRTPSSFLFSVKLYQKFTHPDMFLEGTGAADWDVTRDDLDLVRRGVDPIAGTDRLAAILVQFPASFHATPERRAYLDWLLDALHGYPLAVELRHRSWSDAADDTDAQLAGRRAAWVLIDEPKFKTSIRQSLRRGTSAGRAGDLVYVRLHGRNAEDWWDHDNSEDRYNYLYSGEELRPFADAAREAGKKARRVAMYLNNHFSAKSVANAAILKHQIGQIVPGEYLPEMTARFPELQGVVTTSGLPL
jgi:uncharacterized protein YecE (DUF72 family)